MKLNKMKEKTYEELIWAVLKSAPNMSMEVRIDQSDVGIEIMFRGDPTLSSGSRIDLKDIDKFDFKRLLENTAKGFEKAYKDFKEE